MRKGAANSKRMCIICRYLIAQNGDACTSFFDTLVGSVNMHPITLAIKFGPFVRFISR